MSDVNVLFARRDALESDQRRAVESIDEKIYALLALRFAGDKTLAQALAKLDSKPDGYQFDEGGELEAWIRFDFSDFDERERPYLHDWLLDQGGCVRADFGNDYLARSEGESILVVEDYRRSGSNAERIGVIMSGGRGSEIELDDFTNTEGDVDEERLAWLIERHMERSGYFPGVFYVTSYGSSQDVSLFQTTKRAQAYAERIGYKSVAESFKGNSERRLADIATFKARVAFSTEYECVSIAKIDADGEHCEHAGPCKCEDSEEYFSRSGCDICPEGLAASVFDVVYLAKADTAKGNFKRVLTGQICGACLCALVNGDDSDLDLGTLKA